MIIYLILDNRSFCNEKKETGALSYKLEQRRWTHVPRHIFLLPLKNIACVSYFQVLF